MRASKAARRKKKRVRLVNFVSCAFCSTDREKKETTRSALSLTMPCLLAHGDALHEAV